MMCGVLRLRILCRVLGLSRKAFAQGICKTKWAVDVEMGARNPELNHYGLCDLSEYSPSWFSSAPAQGGLKIHLPQVPSSHCT